MFATCLTAWTRSCCQSCVGIVEHKETVEARRCSHLVFSESMPTNNSTNSDRASLACDVHGQEQAKFGTTSRNSRAQLCVCSVRHDLGKSAKNTPPSRSALKHTTQRLRPKRCPRTCLGLPLSIAHEGGQSPSTPKDEKLQHHRQRRSFDPASFLSPSSCRDGWGCA